MRAIGRYGLAAAIWVSLLGSVGLARAADGGVDGGADSGVPVNPAKVIATYCSDAELECTTGPLNYKKTISLPIAFDWDTGWIPPNSNLQVRFFLKIPASTTVELDGSLETTWPAAMTLATPGGTHGLLAFDYGLEVGGKAKLDVSVLGVPVKWEGDIPYVPQVDFELKAAKNFDPWAFPPSDASITATSNAIRVLEVNLLELAGIPSQLSKGGVALDVKGDLTATYQTNRIRIEPAKSGDTPITSEDGTTTRAFPGGGYVEYDVWPEGQVDYDGALHLIPTFFAEILGQDFSIPMVDIPVSFAIGTQDFIFDPVRVHVPLPDLEPLPTTLDFGSVNVGETKTLTFDVTNTGEAKARTTGFLSGTAPDSFATPAPELLVPSGQTKSYSVAFAPKQVGKWESVLTLVTNDPDERFFKITLRGSGLGVGKTDAGPAKLDDSGQEGGCGCRSAGNRTSAPFALGLVLALGLLFRRRRALFPFVVPFAAGCGSGSDDEQPKQPVFERVDLLAAVEPRIGTGGIGFGVGSTYPGPAVPFAMIHPSPDTRTASGAIGFNHCAGYHAGDPYIGAFSLVHFEGTGVPDYGTIGIIPSLGMSDEKRSEDKRMLPFSAGDETTRAGYYKVRLGGAVDVEVTSSLRAASFRFGFPDGQSPVLILDLDHRLEGQITAADITHSSGGSFDAHVQHFGNMSGSAGGYDLYAHGVVDVAPSQVGTFDATALHAGQTQASGTPLGAWLEFPPGTKTVNLRVAVSFVDATGAHKNLEAEAPIFDFEALQSAAETTWKEAFDRFEIYGANAYDTQLMGTALYHALLMPTLMSDADGRFVDVAGKIATGTGRRYNDFSLWDTYRTLHPWMLLSENDHNQDFAASLVAMAKEGGAVPVWGIAHGDSKTMIGSPGEIVLAESAQKGVAFADESAAYSLARVAAYGPSPGPVGGRDDDLDEYLALGYVPSDVSDGSVSKTQEYAVADAALAHWAERLANAADAEELGARGQNYRHHYDAESGFFRAKTSDGSFAPMGLPTAMDKAYVEGNAWHYLWMAPHDPDGLAETLGGSDAALARLREFFEASENEQSLLGVRQHYWPSNEPDINAPWLFAAWGSPGESARWIDWIVTALYGQGVDGLPGNDDGGTMSAWLLFAGAGLYPVSGTDRYIVASPRYPKIVLHRTSGDLVIEASPAPTPELGPKRVTLDGKPLASTTITHGELVGTHTLRFELTKR